MKKIVIVFFLLLPVISSAEIYQFKNKQGITTLSDKPKGHSSRQPLSVTVKKVFDGDTFLSKSGIKFRLLGIDTPETPRRSKPGDYYGKEAKRELSRLILKKRVYLEYDKRVQDDYDRFLVFVRTSNGVSVNEHLLKNGFARLFVIPPNLSKINEFKSLETEARNSEQGLWQNPEEREVISSSEAWKYQGKIKFVRGQITQLNKKKKGTELVFDDGKFVAYIYKQNFSYFQPLEQYIGKVITIKGKIKRKVKHSTTVFFHPIQLY